VRRNARLLASRPLDGLGKPIGRAYGISAAAIVAAVIAVYGGGAVVDHYDSGRRAANVQAALTARGLGPAQIERVWKRVYRCRHAYVWRTSTRSGSACTDSFSPTVVIYGPGQQPLASR
jgi:hypothetical protein